GGLVRWIPARGQGKDAGRLDTIPGFLPSPGHTLPGCVFAPRCPIAEERCREARPPAFPVGPARTSRCYLHDETSDLPRNTPVDVELLSTRDATEPGVTLRDVSKTFTHSGEPVRALVGINLSLERGETLGLVGESGSGKTTLARALLGLSAPDEGSVVELDGTALAGEARRRPREQLKALQIVFQNPDSALN